MTTTLEAAPAPATAEQTVRPRRLRSVTVEQLAYLGILAVALLVHLWALGDRALHHDETHHANFPWLLYTGQGYVHDPLLHGPFLYFASALVFALVGDSDFTSRLSAAIFGTLLTVSPYLLRRELGRPAALLASCYLLISPVALYIGRFIRHDIFAVVFEVLCVVGLVRYVATRRAGYLYLFSASFGFMVTTMETSYLFLLIIGTFLLALVIWHVDRRLVLLLLAYLLLVGLAKAYLPEPQGVISGPQGTSTPGQTLTMPLVTDSDALLIRHRPDDNWRAYLQDLGAVLFGHETQQSTNKLKGYNGLFLHYWVPVAIGLALLLAGLLIWLIFYRVDSDGHSAWRRAIDNAAPESLLPALDTLRGQRVAIALGLYFLVYATLFTAFYFNSIGVLTGTTGSFLYWLGQHDVRRGGQPGHYYLVLLTVYEPLLLIWGFSGALLGLGYGLRQLLREGGLTARTMLPPLLGWWSLCAVMVYSWAGEKMPWLTLHMVVPLTLMGAWTAWRALPRLLGQIRDESRRPLLFLVAGVLSIGLYGAIRLTSAASSSDPALAASSPAILALVGVMLLVLLLFELGWLLLIRRQPARRALGRVMGGLLLGLSLLLGLYAMRSAHMLSFRNGDVPVELMVYVQSSPDVKRVLQQLRAASVRETGALDMKIMYDNETIWLWYLRNYRNKQSTGGPVSSIPGEDVMAVLLHDTNISASEAVLKDFVKLQLPMRWWFPESEGYRLTPLGQDQGLLARLDETRCPKTSLLERFICTPGDAETVNQVWRYLIHREPPAALGAIDFAIYVRPHLADLFTISPNRTDSTRP